MLPLFLVRLVIGKVLTSPEVKKEVIARLQDLAAQSETTIDDDAVKVVGEVWDVVVGVVGGKIK